jgi:hypothetical protein
VSGWWSPFTCSIMIGRQRDAVKPAKRGHLFGTSQISLSR